MEVNDLNELGKLVESHEKRLDAHEKRLTNQSERLDQHEKQLLQDDEAIKQLRHYDKDKHERLNELEKNYANLSRTVTKENEETRSTMRQQTNRLFELVEQAMGYQSTRTSQNHELKMQKLNTWSTVFLKISGGVVGLLSSGGILYYVIEKIMN